MGLRKRKEPSTYYKEMMMQMPECTREKAMKIVLKYLGEQHKGVLEIKDTLPKTSGSIYNANQLKNSWVIQVLSETLHIGAGRIICISKDTGKIIYDGSDGGE